MKSSAVIGCGFGDEGKGKVVSTLCPQFQNPLVIRYCGGHQAGHHVMLDNGLDHVFSNFGSGTLQGYETYWAKYCTIDPVGILNELDDLINKGIFPKLYIDLDCPVTTPYEKAYNKDADSLTKHGSCGVGVGQTFQREEDHFHLTARDLLFPKVLKIKMDLIIRYYPYGELNIDVFMQSCADILSCHNIEIVSGFPLNQYDHYIFEGSQGLLLDQNFGFFPHVTRSNTGTKNIIDMGFDPEIYLVTRAYQTRHGNGPMTNEGVGGIRKNPYENNPDTGFQGKFRKSPFDIELLKYAISCDQGIKRYHLVITCLDLIDNAQDIANKVRKEMKHDKLFLSSSPLPVWK